MLYRIFLLVKIPIKGRFQSKHIWISSHSPKAHPSCLFKLPIDPESTVLETDLTINLAGQ